MTAERRLAKIETSLSPTQLVLRWLAEAHAYGSLEAYVGSLLDVPADQQPIDRLCREAYETVRARLRGKPAEQLRRAVNSALRETVFRFELVLRIYVTTRELLDREALIDAALSAHVALATSEEAADTARLATLRDLLLFRAGELHAAAEACTSVEQRYLDGHTALFPDVAAAWDEQVKTTHLIADMAVRLAAFDGVPAATPPDPEALSRRTTELVADLVEPAKSTALEKLGESKQALGIANEWVRTKFGQSRAVTFESPADTGP
jgi:hypothetical protein